jgi:DNA-3-methyladenine glycosylase I
MTRVGDATMTAVTNLVAGDDKHVRCSWGASTPDYLAYHDTEWGFGVADDHRLYEKLCLEGFQSGLSWLTILRKRDNFRAAFAGFDPRLVADFDEHDVDRLLNDPGIVRHQGKIRSTINNASRALELIDEFGSIAEYMWPHATFEGPPTEVHALTPTSTAISKDLKKRGWTFVGPTTVYAFMQSVGLVNDHAEGCWVRQRSEQTRRKVYRQYGKARHAQARQ